MGKEQVKFYTTPPNTVQHPYILINANNPNLGYIKKYRRTVESVIIDSGIEIFRNPNIKEYPPKHVYNMVKLYNKVKSILPNTEVYLTVPDYCDDYNPKSLWINDKITNIERTVSNITLCTTKFPNVNWLIPIQGWNKQPKSIVRCIEQLKANNIIDRYNYFAVGNLCVEPNIKIIHQTCTIARKLLPDKKIHVFGLKLTALKYVMPTINSFDSTAWTRPISPKLNANWSCKNAVERERFFLVWRERLEKIMAQTTLEKWVMH